MKREIKVLSDDGGIRDGGLGMFDDFGYSGDFSPGYGALIGTGATAAGMLAAKAFTKKSSAWSKHAWAVGGGVGLVAAGALIAFPHTRRSGMVAAANAILLAALEAVRTLVVEPKQLAGFGLYQPESVQGLGDDRFEILGTAEEQYADALANHMLGAAGGGRGGLEILGQSSPPQIGMTPMDVMGMQGLGMYQSEAINGSPQYL